jgi:hypothetical protein
MTEALATKPVLPVAGEYLHSRASNLSSFTHRPRTGNWRRKLTASSGASGFAISATDSVRGLSDAGRGQAPAVACRFR